MGSIAVIVATYGAPTYREQGIAAAHDARQQAIRADVDHVLAWHGGLSLAESRNHAASLVHDDWLCFLDADDRLGVGYLAAMRTAILDHPGLRLFYPAIDYGRGPGLLPARESLWHGNWLPIGTLIPRALFERCEGFWEERGWEDWSLWIRAAGLGAVPVGVPGAVYQADVNHAGRNRSVTEPYVLGRQIRDTNREWLIRQGEPDNVLARALNHAELPHLERAL